MSGTLFVVGTPIGNLADLSDRARETLGDVDLVAAEDTRRTGRLLQGLGLRKKLVSLHDANEQTRAPEVLAVLREGRSVALVSDGGMPLVSDPGYRLVQLCAAEGVDVRVVPGPSAVLAALVVSGLPTDRFAFEGFPPRKRGERTARLEELRHDPRTLVFFESPLRVRVLLEDLLAVLGDRRVALCRELTKLHEEVLRGRVSQVLASTGDRALKGEVVVVIEGGGPPEPDREAALGEARSLIDTGVRSRDAAREVAERRGMSANELYRSLLATRPEPRG